MKTGPENLTFSVTFHNFSCVILACLLCCSRPRALVTADVGFFFLSAFWLRICVAADVGIITIILNSGFWNVKIFNAGFWPSKILNSGLSQSEILNSRFWQYKIFNSEFWPSKILNSGFRQSEILNSGFWQYKILNSGF